MRTYILAANYQHYEYCRRELGLAKTEAKYVVDIHSLHGVDARYIRFHEYETACWRSDYLELHDYIDYLKQVARLNPVSVHVSLDIRKDIRWSTSEIHFGGG